MRTKAHGLTRPITRKQAKAYELTVPNGRGVTAIAAVSNGRKKPSSAEFAQRYDQTRKLITKAAKNPRRASGVISPARALENKRKGMSAAQAAALARGRAALEARRRAVANAAAHRVVPTLGGVGRSSTPSVGVAQRSRVVPRRNPHSTRASAMEPIAMMYNENKKPRRRKKAKSNKKGRTPAQKAATRKMIAAAKRARRASPNRARKSAKRRVHAKRRAHRNKSVGGGSAAYAAGFDRTFGKKSAKRKTKRRAPGKTRTAAQRRAWAAVLSKKYGKKVSVKRTWKNGRRKARANLIYMPNMFYNQNKRHYRRNRRSARRNGFDFTSLITTALKTTALAGAGFVAHRVLTNQIKKAVLTPEMSKNANIAAMLAIDIGTVLLGSYAASKVYPKGAAEINAGMYAAFAQHLLQGIAIFSENVTLAGASVQLLGYPDATGYQAYSMSGHRGRMLHGVGAYEQLPAGYNGYGAFDVTQAAAGLGEYTQAAAGLGEYTQAAAGVGEYFAQGVSGIGEYEAVNGFGTPELVNEGIHPNLMSAERELSVAEAVAGLGGVQDANYQSIVQAQQVAAPVLDAPGGSRAGILEGGDGIFG